MKWARPKLKNGMGGSPRVMTDVLKPGDVIYVSPREPTDTETDVAGQWSLQQVPKISGALVAMDPHTGRVLALVGGFSFAESRVRPRGAGTPPARLGLQAAHLYHCSRQRLHAGEHHRRRQTLH